MKSPTIPLVMLALSLAPVLLAQDAQPGSVPRIGVMTYHGMAGIATQITSSQISLQVPDHVTFTVRIGPATQFTENRQPASPAAVTPGSPIFVHGQFDIQARTIDASVIALMPATALPLLRLRIANFGRTWTSGMITAMHDNAITVQHMDQSFGTIQLTTNTQTKFHNQPVPQSYLHEGELIHVELERDDPTVADSVAISGMIAGYKYLPW